MRLSVSPWVFLGRLLLFFFVTYLLWQPVAPSYTQLLYYASRAGVWLAELSTDPLWHGGTTLVTRGTAIFYTHRNFAAFDPPIPPQGIPAEWVMANLVLLVPLMLATPAPSWRARFTRLGMALGVALVLQVADVVVAIKVFYASTFRGYWSRGAYDFYQFLDAFFQSWDTQLFPFAIWAGIHFRQLLGSRTAAEPPSGVTRSHPSAPLPPQPTTKAKRRRKPRKR